jgi:hypothetical protein
LKPLVKYFAAFLVLLLTGYSQLVAQLYRGDAFPPSIKSVKGSELVPAMVIKVTGIDEIYCEEEEEKDKEEDKWTSLREYSKDNIHSHPFYFHFQGFHFTSIGNYPWCSRYFANFPFFRPAYLVFRVFRL